MVCVGADALSMLASLVLLQEMYLASDFGRSFIVLASTFKWAISIKAYIYMY